MVEDCTISCQTFTLVVYFICTRYTGVFIDYYGGEAESHIVQYAARLYFVCKSGTELEGPVLEHLKDSYTAHIHFFTEYVCSHTAAGCRLSIQYVYANDVVS